MRPPSLLAILLATFTLAACHSGNPESTPLLIPAPRQAHLQKGVFTFNAHTRFVVENEAQAALVRLLTEQFTQAAGFTPQLTVADASQRTRTDASQLTRTDAPGESPSKQPTHTPATDSAGALVRLTTDSTLAPENYRLDVDPEQIRIEASDLHGFFYALQTIRQQLPAAIEATSPVSSVGWEIPAGNLSDGPRFPYRGLMLDVARTYLPLETIRKTIDAMALLKLNYLHLHLVDDHGWRLEIKRYPHLTEVGAWRVARDGDFAQHANPKKGEPTPVGGFYTQEEMRRLIRYAAARQITIIPEIEMPAHSNAALASYPSLACPVVKDFIGVLPGLGGHAAEIIYCAGNDEVFTFLEGVLDEVMALFPSPYIHLGGDEATKTYWLRCPLCQARMKAEGLTDIEDLQGYFMQRVSNYVKSKGRQVMGWDELTNSTIPEGAIIYGWQGLGAAGYKAGLAGHRFIMTPAQVNYLIRYQGPQWFEPRTYFGNNTLRNVYDYEPVQPDWDPAVAARLLGVQASLWTEFVRTPSDVDYLVFPRLTALAEVAWSPAGKKDWPDFLRRLDAFDAHLDTLGIAYARSMYNLDHRIDSRPDTLLVSISSIRPDLAIRYTVDGSEPSTASPLFPDTLQLTAADFHLKAQLYASGSPHVPTTPPGPPAERVYLIRAATFSADRQMGQTLTLALDWNKATTRPVRRSVASFPTGAAILPTGAATQPGSETLATRSADAGTPAIPSPTQGTPTSKSPTGGTAASNPSTNGTPTSNPPTGEAPVAADPADTLLYRLTNGLRGSDKYTDSEWCGWQGKDVALLVDLGRPEPIRQLILGCITNYGMGVHLPRRIALSVSNDGLRYRPVADRRLSTAQIFRQGIRIDDQVFDFSDLSARYLRIELENPGPCPADHIRPDQPSWVYLDEVIVR